MAMQKQDDQLWHTFSSYVRIRDVVLKTCLGRWTIGRSSERGSGISVLPARHDDDDDDIQPLLQQLFKEHNIVPQKSRSNKREWNTKTHQSVCPMSNAYVKKIRNIYSLYDIRPIFQAVWLFKNISAKSSFQENTTRPRTTFTPSHAVVVEWIRARHAAH